MLSVLAASAALFALVSACSCGAESVEPGNPERGRQVVLSKCTFCHHVEGRGGMIAPPLEKGIALASELVKSYEKRIEDLKLAHPKAYPAAQPAIDAVLAEKDPARRYERWLSAYLTDTKFDNPMTKMGNVLLSLQERADVVAWLVTKRP